MWLITHLPLFDFFIFLRKGERRSRVVVGGRAPGRMGWEACTGVVACFISIIVQAGLWVLQGRFVCHSLEPRGYQGLAFPMINIQRFTSRAKTCSAWIWIYIYLFTLFLNLFMQFFFSLFSSSSTQMPFLICMWWSYF